MALTQAQWFSKIQTWLPSDVTSVEAPITRRFLQGVAKVARELQLKVDAHFADTFIMQSTGGALNIHGYERGVERLPGEQDSEYQLRVQKIFNTSNVSAIESLLAKFLGEVKVLEDSVYGIFCDRGVFINRGACIFELFPSLNCFSFIVGHQDPLNVDYFFTILLKIAGDNKALGTMYRVVERRVEV